MTRTARLPGIGTAIAYLALATAFTFVLAVIALAQTAQLAP